MAAHRHQNDRHPSLNSQPIRFRDKDDDDVENLRQKPARSKPAAPRPAPTSMPQPPRPAPPARGAGAAPADPAAAEGPTPAEILAGRIQSLRSQVNSLQSSALLAGIKDDLEDVQTAVNGLTTLIASVRSAGHVFDADLEPKADELQKGWPSIRDNALQQVNQQVPALQAALRNAEEELRRLVAGQANVNQANAMLPGVENAVQAVSSKASAASAAITGSYDSFRTEADKIKERVDKIRAMMKLAADAKFQLMPTEGVYAVVPAKLDRDGKDDPKGYLYLTDQRLLFEHHEDVATKKVLFIATEKQKVQELLVDMPVSQVEKVTASKKGMLGNEDHIDVLFESGAAVRAAHFHLNGQDCSLWAALINRAKTNDFDRERAVKIDQAVLDKIAEAPTQCPNCGSAFTAPVMRGQTEIKCDYCGTVTRL